MRLLISAPFTRIFSTARPINHATLVRLFFDTVKVIFYRGEYDPRHNGKYENDNKGFHLGLKSNSQKHNSSLKTPFLRWMNWKTELSLGLSTLLLLLLSGCVPEGLMRTWSTEQEYDKQFKSIMVIGLVNNVNLRNEVENEAVLAARKSNLKAANGMSMFPPELGKPFEDVERAKARMREGGFDGIITIALIDVDEKRYSPPEATYEPLVYYDRFRNYYYRTYELVYRPGYFSKDSRFFIETNFYELKGGSLIWSGRSRLFDPSELDSFLPVYSRGLFKELLIEEIIAPF